MPISAKIQRQLVGAYFVHEYSFEAAALFNPSIVAHPDQSGAPEGGRRFILSLRAVGEGHISSLTFRSGSIAADGSVTRRPERPSRLNSHKCEIGSRVRMGKMSRWSSSRTRISASG